MRGKILPAFAVLFVCAVPVLVTQGEEPNSSDPIVPDFFWVNTPFGVQFYDNSTASTEIVQWSWNFADGYGSTRARPLHQYPCQGDYYVSLTVTDANGNIDSVWKTVVVSETQPTCGILQKFEGGLAVNTGGGWLQIPQAFFLFLLIFAIASLALGVEIPYVPKAARILLVVFSIAFLLISYGLLTGFA